MDISQDTLQSNAVPSLVPSLLFPACSFVPVCSFSLPAQISSFFSTFSSQKGFAHHPLTDSPLSSTFSNTSEWMNDFTISISRQVPSNCRTDSFFAMVHRDWDHVHFFIRSVRQLYHLSSTALPLENAENFFFVYKLPKRAWYYAEHPPSIPLPFFHHLRLPESFNPRIYLPLRLISGYPHSALRYILLHELQHYRQKDGLLNLFSKYFLCTLLVQSGCLVCPS